MKQRKEFDLRRLVDDVCEDFAARAAQKRLRFVVSGNGARVQADPMRIQQALANLVDNAIKYGGENDTVHPDPRPQRRRSIAASTAWTSAAPRPWPAQALGWPSPSNFAAPPSRGFSLSVQGTGAPS